MDLIILLYSSWATKTQHKYTATSPFVITYKCKTLAFNWRILCQLIEQKLHHPIKRSQRIDGINNKIKVLSKVVYGCRNFYNFKKRIIVHFKFKAVEKNSTIREQKIHDIK